MGGFKALGLRDPLLLVIKAPKIMARLLRDWISAYMDYTAYNEAPDIFHFWTAVGTIGGALRRRVYIDQEYYLWTPNFYIIFVAKPGIATKSTTARLGAGILGELDGIQFGPNAITWPALISALERATEAVLMPDQQFHSMSCLTFVSSELGSLIDPSDRKMMDVLTDLWDGQVGVWRKETKTSGNNSVVNPWLNIIACTTPTWLSENLPHQMIGGGFTSRCVWVYAEKKRQLIAYPKGIMPQEAKDLKPLLIRDLEVISTLKGEFQLTPEAIELGTKWYGDHWLKPSRDMAGNPQYIGYLARKQGHVHKLAMVLSASASDSLIITAQDLDKAIRITTAMEKDMPNVFHNLNMSASMENTELLVARVRSKRMISKTQLYQSFFPLGYKEFSDILDSAINAGLVQLRQIGGDVMVCSTQTEPETHYTTADTPSALADPVPEGADPSRD